MDEGTRVRVRVCDLHRNGEPTWVPGVVVDGPRKLYFTETPCYLVRIDGRAESDWWPLRHVEPIDAAVA